MFLNLVLIFITLLLYAIVYYIKRRHYWRDRGVPGPPPMFFFGNFFEDVSDTKPESFILRDWTKEYGKVYGFQVGGNNVLATSDLKLIREIFIEKFDNFHSRRLRGVVRNPDTSPSVHVFSARGLRWKRLRTIANPIFSTANIKKMLATVEDSILKMVGHLAVATEQGAPVEIYRYFQELTMDVILRVSMGQKESTQFNNKWLDISKRIFMVPSRHPLSCLGTLFPQYAEVWSFIARKLGRLVNLPFGQFIKDVEKAVEIRRKSQDNDNVHDFIDLFLRAEADDQFMRKLTLEIERYQSAGTAKSWRIEKKLSQDEIVSNCLLFLLAGFETTSTSLAFLAWHLAREPERQKKIQEELDEFCTGEEGITYEQIQKCDYLEKAIKESLRMHPIASRASQRTCMKPCFLGDIFVEAGTQVVADVFTVHYDPEIWGADPEQFIPERWDNLGDLPNVAFMPFGLGPRQCMGMRFALLEEKLAVGHLLRHFDLFTGQQSEKELKIQGFFTINPISVTVYLRERAPMPERPQMPEALQL